MNFLVTKLSPKGQFFRSVLEPVVMFHFWNSSTEIAGGPNFAAIIIEADGFGLPSETAAGEGRTVPHVPSPSAL
jgi:hypothetical protein